MPRRIVLDTDMGSDVDDALCLSLAMAAPEIELVAVMHVSGDTRLRARISRRLLIWPAAAMSSSPRRSTAGASSSTSAAGSD